MERGRSFFVSGSAAFSPWQSGQGRAGISERGEGIPAPERRTGLRAGSREGECPRTRAHAARPQRAWGLAPRGAGRAGLQGAPRPPRLWTLGQPRDVPGNPGLPRARCAEDGDVLGRSLHRSPVGSGGPRQRGGPPGSPALPEAGRDRHPAPPASGLPGARTCGAGRTRPPESWRLMLAPLPAAPKAQPGPSPEPPEGGGRVWGGRGGSGRPDGPRATLRSCAGVPSSVGSVRSPSLRRVPRPVRPSFIPPSVSLIPNAP